MVFDGFNIFYVKHRMLCKGSNLSNPPPAAGALCVRRAGQAGGRARAGPARPAGAPPAGSPALLSILWLLAFS